MRKSTGCFVRGLVALVLLGAIVAIVVSFMGGDDEKHTLIGEILVFTEDGITVDGDTCTGSFGGGILQGGEELFVQDGSLDGLKTTLATGQVTPEGNCSFEFVVDVEQTDIYGFSVGDFTALRRDDTIEKDVPDGFRHSQADKGDWWVSMWGSDFEK